MIKSNASIQLSNPDKLLFPQAGITKLDYVKALHQLSPFLLYHTKNRNLTTIHFPDGAGEKSYYQKSVPSHAPDFVARREMDGNESVVLDSLETLLWMGNMAALEFHIPFNAMDSPDYPDALIFDLDPSEGQTFPQVIDAALIVHETLKELGINSFCKTSGATGIQIAIPAGRKLHYDIAREINQFFGHYFAGKYPKIFTIERKVNARGKKLYFDYLQMWKGKTIISPYSPRATKTANVSTPLLWEELKKGAAPEDFTLKTIEKRLKKMGDIYQPVLSSDMEPGLQAFLNRMVKA
ncbi:MAG: non-homologous end-joining DNA ligase [Thermoclostridium sp.]|nr:non-homologous end-joining DNA ligase [Thermoclostridium sp.]